MLITIYQLFISSTVASNLVYLIFSRTLTKIKLLKFAISLIPTESINVDNLVSCDVSPSGRPSFT